MKVRNKGNVPAKPFVKILKEYIEIRETNHAAVEDERVGSHRDMLCIKVGINPRMLSRLLSGEQKEVHFDTADRIMCGMGMVDYWWGVEPFCTFYDEVDLTVPSTSKRWEPTLLSSECRECGAMFEHYSSKNTKRVYCSNKCRSAKASRSGGEAKSRGGRAARALRPRGSARPHGQYAPLEKP